MGKAARQRQQARETGSGAAATAPPADRTVPIPAPAMAELAALWLAKQRAEADMNRAFNLVLLALGEDLKGGVWSMDTDACTATCKRPPAASPAAGPAAQPPAGPPPDSVREERAADDGQPTQP